MKESSSNNIPCVGTVGGEVGGGGGGEGRGGGRGGVTRNKRVNKHGALVIRYTCISRGTLRLSKFIHS